MVDAEAPPLYGNDEELVASIEATDSSAYDAVAKERTNERKERELAEDSAGYAAKASRALDECKKPTTLKQKGNTRFKIYMKYEGRKGPPMFLKVRLPLHGGFEDGPSLGIKKMFVDKYNAVRQFITYFSCHLRSEIGIGIPDEDAVSGYVPFGGLVIVCDGSPPGKPPEGQVVAWGRHTFSDLKGQGPEVMLSLQRKRIITVSCGVQHTQVLSEGGRIFGWGQNDFGQLGTGDENPRPLPAIAAVPFEAFIADIACGNEFGMARTKKGELWTWGRMQASNWPRLFTDSWCNGYESKGEMGIKGLKVTAFSAGELHAAVVADGKCFTWGYNDYGQLGWGLHGKDKSGQQKPKELVLPTGDPETGAVPKVVRVACGGAHTLVCLDDGRVFGWGSNIMGQLNHGLRDVFAQPMEIPTAEPIAEVYAGRQSSIVVAKTRFAQIWGRFQAEEPKGPGDDWKNDPRNQLHPSVHGEQAAEAPEEVAASPAAAAEEAAEVPTGDVMARFADQNASIDGEVLAGALGEAHGCVAMADGGIVGWGYNSVMQASGQISPDTFVAPQRLLHGTGKAKVVACGGSQSIAVVLP